MDGKFRRQIQPCEISFDKFEKIDLQVFKVATHQKWKIVKIIKIFDRIEVSKIELESTIFAFFVSFVLNAIKTCGFGNP